MAKWAISPKPSAELTIVDEEPTQMDDGATVQRFKTKSGVIFARRVEASGLVKWFLQLEA
jgi:hypothetical protein